MINQLQEEVKSTVTSYKKLEEYEEVRAYDFMEGYWYGATQVQKVYSQYSLDF